MNGAFKYGNVSYPLKLNGEYFWPSVVVQFAVCVKDSAVMAFAFEESHKQATHHHCFCYTISCGSGFNDLILFMS